MWIESEKPIRVRSPRGEVHLQPGHPIELPDELAKKIVEKAQGKIKIVDKPRTDIAMEPASTTALSVFFENAKGELCGPVVPEYLGKVGLGDRERFWIVVQYQGVIRWIMNDRLRTAPKRMNTGVMGLT